MMAKSGLLGPYLLAPKVIENMVTNSKDWSSASVFALGEVRNMKFLIRLVGHADGDLAESLQKYIGTYDVFRFSFYRSTRSAYDKECYLYHDFKPRDNLQHPIKPRNTKFTCPVITCRFSD